MLNLGVCNKWKYVFLVGMELERHFLIFIEMKGDKENEKSGITTCTRSDTGCG